MTSEKDEERDKERGGLTERDKRYLLGEWKNDEMHPRSENHPRQLIKKRIITSLQEFELLNEELDTDMRKKIFKKIDIDSVVPEVIAFLLNGINDEGRRDEILSLIEKGIDECEVDVSPPYEHDGSYVQDIGRVHPDLDTILEEDINDRWMRYYNSIYEENLIRKKVAKVHQQIHYKGVSFDDVQINEQYLTLYSEVSEKDPDGLTPIMTHPFKSTRDIENSSTGPDENNDDY